jgi:ribosomal-protein-alanine N-acetyltransferase
MMSQPPLHLHLTTTRLQLREMVPADADQLYAYNQDPDFTRYEEGASMSDIEFRGILEGIIAERWQNPRTSFYVAIVHPDEPYITLGSIYVAIRDESHKQGEIGYVLGKPYWGRGYATEAGRAMLDFGFKTLGLHRIYAECNSENIASVRVLEKMGMRREGHLKHTQYFSGRWWDTLIFGLLAGEYEAGADK